mgnify:CR=1 FL=1
MSFQRLFPSLPVGGGHFFPSGKGLVTVSQTRYFKNATTTVNGLSANALALDLAGSSASVAQSATGATDGDLGIGVYKRDSAGVETELTAGTPVAIVTYVDGDSGVLRSNTWNAPQTLLASTDSIVVRVYGRVPSGTGTWKLLASWTTEQLGAKRLETATWTIKYYGSFTYSITLNLGTLYFNFDGTRPSCIENFTWKK